MAASPSAEVRLTPEQRRRLGAVYHLILSWKRGDNDQKLNLNEQGAQVTQPQDKPEVVAHPPDNRGLT